jgi:hypothetical protein
MNSSMDERILTLPPPQGKSGVNISRAKYDRVRRAIQGAIREHGEIERIPGRSPQDLMPSANQSKCTAE